jgi:lipopolysaccharide biosynthesis glycosyltransferase
MHLRPIHVGICFDRAYLHPFHALLNSIITNHSTGQLHIHLIADGISREEKHRISKQVKRSGNAVCFYELQEHFLKDVELRGNWPRAAYYRLFLPDLTPRDINRLLYLDADTIVVNSLESLYNIDLSDYPVGAVYDNYVRTQPLLGIYEEGAYFNSGVLVIDSEKWRQEAISEKAKNFLLQHSEKIRFADQCALNAIFYKKWKRLDVQYNMMYSALPQDVGRDQLANIMKKVVVIHFTLQRPWHMLCKNRLRHLYFHNLNKSGIYLPPWKLYIDFRLNKLPGWLMIRLREFYFDNRSLQRAWKSFQTR